MHAAQEQPARLLRRIVRWIGDFDRAMDIEPVADLEQRVAHLEGRIALLGEVDSGSDAANQFRSRNAREI